MVLFAADSIRAHTPTKIGEARLVPPTCSVDPSTMINAPDDDAASKDTSGPTRWVVPEPSAVTCQDGADSNALVPPPVAHRRSLVYVGGPIWARPSFHTVSPVHVVPVVESVVPPTWIT